jgi:hypothetical protein
LNLWKEQAEQICTRYGLDTIQKTIVARHLKRQFSNLMLSGIKDYAVISSILNAGVLSPRDVKELEATSYKHLEQVRLFLLSRGQKTVLDSMKAEEKALRQPLTAIQ